MRRQVSEKTLELNVSAEILQVFRRLPGCNRAFWYGFKQDQEARWGVDETLRNVPRGHHLILQFKSPRPMPRDIVPYKFTINEKQNNNLLRLANARPNAVYYVFPHYNTLATLGNRSPSLLGDTWFLRVADLNGLSAASNAKGTHTVESHPGRATVHSDLYEVDTVSLGAIKKLFSDGYSALRRYLPNRGRLGDWIDETHFDSNDEARIIGQLYRGLGIICFPGDGAEDDAESTQNLS